MHLWGEGAAVAVAVLVRLVVWISGAPATTSRPTAMRRDRPGRGGGSASRWRLVSWFNPTPPLCLAATAARPSQAPLPTECWRWS